MIYSTTAISRLFSKKQLQKPKLEPATVVVKVDLRPLARLAGAFGLTARVSNHEALVRKAQV